MWDLPRPGHEPVSLALANGFLTTAPPGKPSFLLPVGQREKGWEGGETRAPGKFGEDG